VHLHVCNDATKKIWNDVFHDVAHNLNKKCKVQEVQIREHLSYKIFTNYVKPFMPHKGKSAYGLM
jgi:hypothetical protein